MVTGSQLAACGLFAALAVCARPLPIQAQISATDPDIAYAEGKITPWKSARCDAPRFDYPRWNGFPVTLCDYTDIGVTVRTYMLNADRNRQRAGRSRPAATQRRATFAPASTIW